MTQTLQEFLESEKKEFDDLMVLTDSTVNLPLWLSSHDSRLIAHLREMIEGIEFEFYASKDEYLRSVEAWDGKSYDQPFDDGYKRAKQDLLSLLTDIK